MVSPEPVWGKMAAGVSPPDTTSWRREASFFSDFDFGNRFNNRLAAAG